MVNFIFEWVLNIFASCRTAFLMENVRKFSDQVGAYQAENAQLEHTKAQMQEQVMYMQDDWKRE